MKKILSIICLILICFTFVACNQSENSDEAIITIGESKQFSEKEINEAIVCVKKKFKDFEGCELTALWYDEEKSSSIIKSYMSSGRGSVNGVDVENVIVLLSNFDVDSSGGDGSFNPNSTYSDWNWILIRDSKISNWQVDDWGY